MGSKNQIVLVTGATAGIGRHAVLHLAERGHRVIATGRKEALLAELAKDARTRGLEIDTVVLDVTSAASIRAASAKVDELTAGHGLDVLINNAGYGQFGPLELVSDEDLRAQFETNVFGLMAVTRAFLPVMRERGRGRILNVSSVGGRVTFPMAGAYHATKYAVEAMSDAMRNELAPFGIHVSVIEPGPIKSEFADRAMDAFAPYRGEGSPYAPLLVRADDIKKQTDKMSGDPISVSRAIAHAIEARRPRVRYVMPFSSRLVVLFFSILPTRLADALMRAAAGIKPQQLPAPAQPRELTAGA